MTQLSAQMEDRLRTFRRSATPPETVVVVDYMLGLINGARARLLHRFGIDRDLVVAAEALAASHVDYEHRLAQSCVELVFLL